MTTTVPAYTYGGITRPALILDDTGHVVLTPTAADFVSHYGMRALYMGLPYNTPYPPVAASLSAPTDSNGTGNSVLEGAAAGTAVNITASSSSSSGNPVTYSLTADSSGGGFTINATTGVVTVADASKIDFESAPGHAYTITVKANDAILTSTQNFIITVNDVAPSTPVDTNAAANAVAECAAVGSQTGVTAHATDVNGGALTYSITADSSGGGFKIDASTGVITVADGSKIDYETAPGHAYTVTVKASDGALFTTQTFTIGVNDVAIGAPVDTNGAGNQVAEGASAGTTVGITASATDPNGPASTYAMINDTSGGGFTINATTGVVTVADPSKIDYESAPAHAYSITVQATNGASITTQAFTINVTDVAPTTPTDSNGTGNLVAEGASAGTTVNITAASTDVNGGTVTYSLTSDTSGGGFTINATTGVVTVADPSKIDYESAPAHAYSITVQASDGSMTSTQSFTIGVTDVAPSTPIDSNGAGESVAENATAGATVGVMASSTDVNGGAVTYSLTSDTSGGGFTINATTGVVTVADPSKIDYESAPGHAYGIIVQASDGSQASSQSFTINVTNVAPSTPVDSDGAGNSVAEGATAGTTVGVTASSSDIHGGTVTYSLTGDTSGGGFTINATTGVVTVADPSKIDFESSGGSYSVTAQASDGTDVSSQSFTITVTDVAPSTPVDSDGGTNIVAQSAPNGTHVGLTASSTDVNGPAVAYSLVGDTSGGGFTINASTGVVSVADTSKVVYNAGSPTYDVTVRASDGTQHSDQTFTINVVLDIPPSITAGNTVGYTENDAATTISPALTLTDSDNANLVSASVQITGNYVNGQDILSFVNTPAITGSFNAATGTLTLTGTDTVANYRAALQSVKYFNNSENPSGLARTVTFTANDGTLDSSPATSTINVTPVNDAPVVTAGHTLNYTENQAATAFDSAITVSDVDNANLTGATVQITGNYANGQDVLAFANTANITGTFNAATGTLTLSGSETVANYQAALAAVTYVNTSENPSGLARTVTIIATDGVTPSSAVTGTINVTPVNDPPVTTAGGSLNYTENQAATAIDNTITVSDVDNANISSATVQITGNYANGQDILGFTTQNGITGSFNAATGTLSLTGSSSVANYQAALRSVTYFDNSDNPSGLDRTVSYTVNDGTANSNSSTSTVHVTPVNDAPVVTATGTLAYTENDGAKAVAPALTLTDPDTATISSASVQISANYINGEDSLGFSNTANITGSFNASTGTLTLTGTDTFANYQAALRSVTYTDNSENPSTAARTVTFTADDGQSANHQSAGSNHTVTVTSVDDAPTATAPADNSVGTAFSHTDLAISGLSVADIDAGSGNVTATIAATHASLSFDTSGLSSSSNNGSHTVTLTGTVAAVNTALGTLTYNSDDNFTGTDTVTLNVNDNGNTGTGGPLSSGNQTFHVGVVPQVWYIDASNAQAGTGDGSAANPFHTIAAFNGASGPGVNDVIVIKSGTYTGDGLNLQDGQSVYGSGETLSFTNPVTNATVTILDGTGARPTIHVTTNGDQGIDLATNNVIHGVNVATDAGTTGIDDVNNAVGNLTIDHMAISGAGQAVDINQGGNLNVTLDSLSSTGGAQGVQLAGTAASGAGLLTGSFSVTSNTGSISGSTGSGFLVGDGAGGANTGGSIAISYGGNITTTGSASVVNIQDHITGTVTLSGTLTHTAGNGPGIILDDDSGNVTFSGLNSSLTSGTSNGISISDYTNGTVLFSGSGLDINTTTGTGVSITGTNTNGNFNFTGGNFTIDSTGGGDGFVATGGGTVNVTGSNNHIATTTGTALNISNTAIGASNVTFHDITSNGGSNNGINLVNTGTAAGNGGLHVTGTGTSAGSGGTIANKTGADGSTTQGSGIFLNGTKDVQLANMQLNDFQNFAIHGNNVTGFTLDHSVINGDNGTSNSVSDGVAGFAANVGEDAVRFTNLLGSGSITNSTISGGYTNTIMVENNTGTLDRLTIDHSTVGGRTNNGTGMNDGINFQADTGSTAMNLTVTNTALTTARAALIAVTNQVGTNVDVVFDNNTLTNNHPQTVSGGPGLDLAGLGNMTFDVSNNTFDMHAANGGAGIKSHVIEVNKGSGSGSSTFDGTIAGNTIGVAGTAHSGSGLGSNDIDINSQDAGSFTVLIKDNILTHYDTAGIQITQGPGSSTVNATVVGNTTSNGDANAFTGLYVVAGVGLAGDHGVVNLKVGGTGTERNDFSNGDPANGSDVFLQASTPGTSVINLTKGASSSSSPSQVVKDNNLNPGTTVVATSGTINVVNTTPTLPLRAAAGGVQALSPNSGDMHLTQAELDSVVTAAIAQWAAAGASAEQLAALHATTFSIANLSGNTIGDESSPAHITIDVDGAGHGWFVDPTPFDNSEFTHAANASGTDLYTDPFNPAAGHLDLLTTVSHEMGHVLGLPDQNAAGAANDLMYINLVDGERRLPTAADVHATVAADSFSFAVVSPTLPPVPGLVSPTLPTVAAGVSVGASPSPLDMAVKAGNFVFEMISQAAHRTDGGSDLAGLVSHFTELADLFSGAHASAVGSHGLPIGGQQDGNMVMSLKTVASEVATAIASDHVTLPDPAVLAGMQDHFILKG